MYGKLPWISAPRWISGLHRWSGRIAFILTVIVAVHCLYALGFESFNARVLAHSVAGCLFFGVFMAGIKEMKDTSLKNLKDVRAYTNLPVLSSVPLLENALLVRRKRRLFWLAWSVAVIFGAVAVMGSMYYYYFGQK